MNVKCIIVEVRINSTSIVVKSWNFYQSNTFLYNRFMIIDLYLPFKLKGID